MALQARFKLENMFKRNGKLLTFKLLTHVITDEFYQTKNTTIETYTCYGTVIPARAYDLHSNIVLRTESTGDEPMGIINILISPADEGYIDEGDYYIDDTAQYTITSKEIWSDEFYILEGHLNDVV